MRTDAVELERPAAGGRLGIAEHDANLLAQLVDEDEAGPATSTRRRSACAAPATSGAPGGPSALHPSLPRSPRAARAPPPSRRRQRPRRSERTRTSTISSACSPLSGCDTSRFSRSTPSFFGVLRVERVLGVDERGQAAALLRLCNHLQRERGLAGRLRTEDLDDAAARHSADAKRVVETDRAGRDGRHRHHRVLLAEAHDRSLAELLFDLADGKFYGLQAFTVQAVICGGHLACCRHLALL